MAPEIKVPMDFGVHLRSSPTHNTLKLNTSEGGEVLASSVILSFNSPIIDHMTTTLHMTSVDMLEFSEAAVQVFVDAAYSGTAEGINREIFRDINKMANVFEVVWLMEKCSEYFTEVTNSIKTSTYSELLYLFEEACFVYENVDKKDYIELVNDKIQELDWKQQFIDKYLENADRLSTKRLDMVIELAGSDVNFVVKTLVNQLTEMFKVQEPRLPASFKYMLDRMKLSVCVRSEESGFYQLFELLENLPSEYFKWSYNLLLRSTKKAASSDLFCAQPTTAKQVTRCKTVPNLYHSLDFDINFDEILKFVSVSENINSLLMAIEAVCTWNYYNCTWNNYNFKSSRNRRFLVNTNRLETELPSIAKKRGWPLPPFDFAAFPFRIFLNDGSCKDLMLTAFCSSKENSDSVVIKSVETHSNPYSALSQDTKLTFHFKHPSVTSCSLPGKCGFILKTVPSEAALWKLELCTEDKDYHDTDVHFHGEIKAKNMHVFFIRSFDTRFILLSKSPSFNIFPLSWLCYFSSTDERERWSGKFTTNELNRFSLVYYL